MSVALRKPDWGLLPEALKGSICLLALVTCASLMPGERLPAASWQTAFGLGFGCSAGVAISNMYRQAKSVGRWLKHGWHVTLAYGFLVMLALPGWHPTDNRGNVVAEVPAVASVDR